MVLFHFARNGDALWINKHTRRYVRASGLRQKPTTVLFLCTKVNMLVDAVRFATVILLLRCEVVSAAFHFTPPIKQRPTSHSFLGVPAEETIELKKARWNNFLLAHPCSGLNTQVVQKIEEKFQQPSKSFLRATAESHADNKYEALCEICL